MKSPFLLFFGIALLLVTTSCAPFRTYTGTVVHKSYEPHHIETRKETQIVRGTLHDNVPTDYAVPERYLLYLELDSISPRDFAVSKAKYDSTRVGQKVTITTGRKPRSKP